MRRRVATTYFKRVLAIDPTHLLGYWPLWEPGGSVAYDISGHNRHGAYTGVTLGHAGIGDGNGCPFFDGANDYANIYSASLASAFNGAEGTVAVLLKVAKAGVWTDGTNRMYQALKPNLTNNQH